VDLMVLGLVLPNKETVQELRPKLMVMVVVLPMVDIVQDYIHNLKIQLHHNIL
jgi:hypothetical protein